MSQRLLYARTVVICYSYFVFAVIDNIPSPCLLDFVGQIQGTVQDVSNSISTSAASYCFAALILGHMFRQADNTKAIVICLIISGIFNYLMTRVRDLPSFLITMVITGTTSGAIDVISNTWMQQVWGGQADAYLHAMYCCAAIGSIVAPLMTASYLSTEDSPSRIIIPFSHASMMCFMAAAALLILKFMDSGPPVPHVVIPDDVCVAESITCKEKQAAIVDEEIEVIETEGSEVTVNYRLRMISLMFACILICSYGTMDLIAFNYFPVFVVYAGIHVSKSTAALMLSVFAAFYTLTRGITILTATRISAAHQLVINFMLMAVGFSLNIMFSDSSEAVIWFSAGLLGAAYGNSQPAIILLVHQMIPDVSENMNNYLIFFSRLAGVPVQIIIGSLIEQHALSFVYINFVCLILACLSLTCMTFLSKISRA